MIDIGNQRQVGERTIQKKHENSGNRPRVRNKAAKSWERGRDEMRTGRSR